MGFYSETLLHNKDNTFALVENCKVKPSKRIGIDPKYLRAALDYLELMSSDDVKVVQIAPVMSCDDAGPLLGITVPQGKAWLVIAPISGDTDDLEVVP